MVLVNLIAAAGLVDSQKDYLILKKTILGASMLSVTAILMLTYSRGGWMGYLTALLFLGCCDRRLRKWCFTALMLFAISLIFIPSAGDRFKSIASGSDLSIVNRIEVWKGALAATKANALHGIGDGRFGRYFAAWYEPENMKGNYANALSNYLTLAVEQGLATAWIYMVVFLVMISAGWLTKYTESSYIIHGLSAGIVAYSANVLFTYMLNSTSLNISLGLSAILIIVLCARSTDGKAILIRSMGYGLLGGSSAVALVFILSVVFSERAVCHVDVVELGSRVGDNNLYFLRPIELSERGTVIYIQNRGEDAVDIGRNLVTRFVKRGFSVILSNYHYSAKEDLAEVENILKWACGNYYINSRPIYLVGDGWGGQVGLLVASLPQYKGKLHALSAVDVDLYSPFSSLAAYRAIGRVRCPVLLIYSHGNSIRWHEAVGLISELKMGNIAIANYSNDILRQQISDEEMWESITIFFKGN